MDFRLGPPSAGDCNDDQFIVRANDPLPTLCGDNTGQHMYVDVAKVGDDKMMLYRRDIKINQQVSFLFSDFL